MTFRPGDVIGDYRIVALLGRGGMGHVFKVEHVITRRLEAMKVLLRDQASQPEFIQRFLREVQVQASLNHPNIAAVHNAFLVQDDLLLIMELIEGESLESMLQRGPLPWPEPSAMPARPWQPSPMPMRRRSLIATSSPATS
jgi:Serine/threonine protein kinase